MIKMKQKEGHSMTSEKAANFFCLGCERFSPRSDLSQSLSESNNCQQQILSHKYSDTFIHGELRLTEGKRRRKTTREGGP